MSDRTSGLFFVIALILAILFALCASAHAATFPAADCTQSSVAAAVALASNGDTVTVPVCSGAGVNWTDVLTINVGITLQGAGIGQTIINDERLRGFTGGPGTLLQVNIPTGAFFRLTGFTFRDGAEQTVAFDGSITLSGCSITTASYRIDHNRFNQLVNTVLRFSGNLYGVTDNNIFLGSGLTTQEINYNNLTWPRDGVNCTGRWADGSWAFPLPLDAGAGSIRAHYLETNTFAAITTTTLFQAVDSNNGARTVVRNNTFTDVVNLGSHGTDTGQRNRSQRWYEIYNNTFNFVSSIPGVDFVIWIRGGSGVVFGNNVSIPSGQSINWYVKHLNLRSDDPSLRLTPPWTNPANTFPNCDGTAVWDGNQPGLAGYRCLDQPGAGQAVDFLDTDTPPNIQAQNVAEPIYVWNNMINGISDNCGSAFGCGSDGKVVAGRDIFFGQSRPGYQQLVYPHPLASGTTPPGTPSNLVVN